MLPHPENTHRNVSKYLKRNAAKRNMINEPSVSTSFSQFFTTLHPLHSLLTQAHIPPHSNTHRLPLTSSATRLTQSYPPFDVHSRIALVNNAGFFYYISVSNFLLEMSFLNNLLLIIPFNTFFIFFK